MGVRKRGLHPLSVGFYPGSVFSRIVLGPGYGWLLLECSLGFVGRMEMSSCCYQCDCEGPERSSVQSSLNWLTYLLAQLSFHVKT